MIEYLYSNMKSVDIQHQYMNMQHAGITHYVCDYKPDSSVTQLLKLVNIKSYYRIKIFPQHIEDFDFVKLEEEVNYAKEMGFNGIAIDAEAYSNSTIWTSNGAKAFGKTLSSIISRQFSKVAVFPEDLGGYKYAHYQSFLEGLFSNEDIETYDLLMERTYNQGEWYNILVFYWKQCWLFRNNPKVRVFPGVWYEAVAPRERDQQRRVTEWIGKRFYYSESTDFMIGR